MADVYCREVRPGWSLVETRRRADRLHRHWGGTQCFWSPKRGLTYRQLRVFIVSETLMWLTDLNTCVVCVCITYVAAFLNYSRLGNHYLINCFIGLVFYLNSVSNILFWYLACNYIFKTTLNIESLRWHVVLNIAGHMTGRFMYSALRYMMSFDIMHSVVSTRAQLPEIATECCTTLIVKG